MQGQNSSRERKSSTRGQNTSGGRGDLQSTYSWTKQGRRKRGSFFRGQDSIADTGDINICVDGTAVNGGELCSASRLYRDDSQRFCLSNSAFSCTVHLYEVESQWKKLPYIVPASFLSAGFLPPCSRLAVPGSAFLILPYPVLPSSRAPWQSLICLFNPILFCILSPL
jgi:hypothetical protein